MSMLVAGIVLMVGGLAFAVYPFLRRSTDDDAPPSPSPRPAPRGTAKGRVPVEDALALEREELTLDHAMGKLSDADYGRMLAALDARARRAESAASTPPSPASPAAESPAPTASSPASSSSLEEEAERLVRAERVNAVTCPDCGPRPEPGARFCSSCGRALGGCPRCGAAVRAGAARYCDQCGAPLRS
ncbi:MAG: zinc ribbon domain-containing protein [Gemmatimonadaceae bacterium]|nr:zinc ribbon domain-containing protein [Gemmatimonadaceae bacterium]